MKKIIPNLAGLILILTIVDQLTKRIAMRYTFDPVHIIGDFFTLKLSLNTGIAFSIPMPFITILIVNSLLLILLLVFAFKELDLNKRPALIITSLIIAGGLGNLIDRLMYFAVIDFISIWRYPSFNFADIYITVGVLAFLVFYGRINRTKIKK
ncbi:signal peptidase II [Candidatus Peregrinibacteria bacterium]|nr:signal peptidase II [Candidatus Peregrinibacteria bacterium]